VYSSEYTDIPKVFFTPYDVSYCCMNVIRGHCCATVYQQWPLCPLLLSVVFQQLSPFMQVVYPRTENAKDRQTNMDGPLRCFSPAVEREEHPKILLELRRHLVLHLATLSAEEQRRLFMLLWPGLTWRERLNICTAARHSLIFHLIAEIFLRC
jgi:hypothetical protein